MFRSKKAGFSDRTKIKTVIFVFVLSTFLSISVIGQSRDANAEVTRIKNEILELARSYAGQGDPDRSKQKALEALVEKLLKANPQPPVKDRLPILYGAWKQEWGPYDYKQNRRGVDRELGVKEIYQVVFPGGYYYNIAPNYRKGDVTREKITFLKGEYKLDPTQQNTLLVKFKSLRGLDKRPSDGTQLYEIPALAESKKLKNVKTVLPGFLVRLLFGGGALKEVYTDHDMRITYGADSNKFKDDFIYILTRAENIPQK